MVETIVSEAQRIVLSELTRQGPLNYAGESHVRINCPFHNEYKPSLHVVVAPQVTSNIPIGMFHCFGCGEKGHWNILAEKLGLSRIAEGQDRVTETYNINVAKVRQSLLGSEEGYRQRAKDSLLVPCTEDWRGISVKTIRKVGGMLRYNNEIGSTALRLPINVRGETRGTVNARVIPHKHKPNYITSPGPWVKAHGLFPFDYVEKNWDQVALVEGPRDALRLLQYGIPALAILGTRAWSTQKKNLILGSFFHVVLAFDGDKPGVSCTNLVYSDLKYHCSLKVFKLAPASKKKGRCVDPGNMGIGLIRKLRKLFI